jgi:hypothetical protein
MPISQTHGHPSTLIESPPGARSERVRRFGRFLLIATICSLLGYAGGMLHGFVRARPVRQRLEIQTSELEQTLARTKTQLVSERQARAELGIVLDLYDAHAETALALLALDEHNFGIAETRVRAAESRVRGLTPQRPRLAELQSMLAAANVTMAGELAAQRAALNEIAAELERQIETGRRDAARLPLE